MEGVVLGLHWSCQFVKSECELVFEFIRNGSMDMLHQCKATEDEGKWPLIMAHRRLINDNLTCWL